MARFVTNAISLLILMGLLATFSSIMGQALVSAGIIFTLYQIIREENQ